MVTSSIIWEMALQLYGYVLMEVGLLNKNLVESSKFHKKSLQTEIATCMKEDNIH